MGVNQDSGDKRAPKLDLELKSSLDLQTSKSAKPLGVERTSTLKLRNTSHQIQLSRQAETSVTQIRLPGAAFGARFPTQPLSLSGRDGRIDLLQPSKKPLDFFQNDPFSRSLWPELDSKQRDFQQKLLRVSQGLFGEDLLKLLSPQQEMFAKVLPIDMVLGKSLQESKEFLNDCLAKSHNSPEKEFFIRALMRCEELEGVLERRGADALLVPQLFNKILAGTSLRNPFVHSAIVETYSEVYQSENKPGNVLERKDSIERIFKLCQSVQGGVSKETRLQVAGLSANGCEEALASIELSLLARRQSELLTEEKDLSKELGVSQTLMVNTKEYLADLTEEPASYLFMSTGRDEILSNHSQGLARRVRDAAHLSREHSFVEEQLKENAVRSLVLQAKLIGGQDEERAALVVLKGALALPRDDWKDSREFQDCFDQSMELLTKKDSLKGHFTETEIGLLQGKIEETFKQRTADFNDHYLPLEIESQLGEPPNFFVSSPIAESDYKQFPYAKKKGQKFFVDITLSGKPTIYGVGVSHEVCRELNGPLRKQMLLLREPKGKREDHITADDVVIKDENGLFHPLSAYDHEGNLIDPNKKLVLSSSEQQFVETQQRNAKAFTLAPCAASDVLSLENPEIVLGHRRVAYFSNSASRELHEAEERPKESQHPDLHILHTADGKKRLIRLDPKAKEKLENAPPGRQPVILRMPEEIKAKIDLVEAEVSILPGYKGRGRDELVTTEHRHVIRLPENESSILSAQDIGFARNEVAAGKLLTVETESGKTTYNDESFDKAKTAQNDVQTVVAHLKAAQMMQDSGSELLQKFIPLQQMLEAGAAGDKQEDYVQTTRDLADELLRAYKDGDFEDNYAELQKTLKELKKLPKGAVSDDFDKQIEALEQQLEMVSSVVENDYIQKLHAHIHSDAFNADTVANWMKTNGVIMASSIACACLAAATVPTGGASGVAAIALMSAITTSGGIVGKELGSAFVSTYNDSIRSDTQRLWGEEITLGEFGSSLTNQFATGWVTSFVLIGTGSFLGSSASKINLQSAGYGPKELMSRAVVKTAKTLGMIDDLSLRARGPFSRYAKETIQEFYEESGEGGFEYLAASADQAGNPKAAAILKGCAFTFAILNCAKGPGLNVDSKCKATLDQVIPEGDLVTMKLSYNGMVETLRAELEREGISSPEPDSNGIIRIKDAKVVTHEDGSRQNVTVVREYHPSNEAEFVRVLKAVSQDQSGKSPLEQYGLIRRADGSYTAETLRPKGKHSLARYLKFQGVVVNENADGSLSARFGDEVVQIREGHDSVPETVDESNFTPGGSEFSDTAREVKQRVRSMRKKNPEDWTSEHASEFDSQLERLHDDARKVLSMNGVSFKEVRDPESNKVVALIISPDKDGAPLNQYAARMMRSKGAELRYDPQMLFTQQAGALYDHRNKQLYLPHDAIAELSSTDEVYHEKIHSTHEAVRAGGGESVFFGEIVADDTSQPMWKEGKGGYDRYLSLDELVTYSAVIKRRAERLSHLARTRGSNPKEIEKLARQINEDSEVLSVISANTHSLFAEQVLPLLSANPSAIELQRTTVRDKKGESIEIIQGVLSVGNARICLDIGPKEKLIALGSASGTEIDQDLAQRVFIEKIQALAKLSSGLRQVSGHLSVGQEKVPLLIQNTDALNAYSEAALACAQVVDVALWSRSKVLAEHGRKRKAEREQTQGQTEEEKLRQDDEEDIEESIVPFAEAAQQNSPQERPRLAASHESEEDLGEETETDFSQRVISESLARVRADIETLEEQIASGEIAEEELSVAKDTLELLHSQLRDLDRMQSSPISRETPVFTRDLQAEAQAIDRSRYGKLNVPPLEEFQRRLEAMPHVEAGAAYRQKTGRACTYAGTSVIKDVPMNKVMGTCDENPWYALNDRALRNVPKERYLHDLAEKIVQGERALNRPDQPETIRFYQIGDEYYVEAGRHRVAALKAIAEADTVLTAEVIVLDISEGTSAGNPDSNGRDRLGKDVVEGEQEQSIGDLISDVDSTALNNLTNKPDPAYVFEELWDDVSATGDKEVSAEARQELFQKLESEFKQQRKVMPIDWRGLGIKPNTRGLIIGAGTGIEAHEMQEQLGGSLELECLDQEKDMVEYAQSHNPYPKQTTFKQADAFTFSSEQKFDFVEMRRIFSGMGKQAELLANLRKIVKPGGLVIIDDLDVDGIQAEPANAGVEQIREIIQQGCVASGGTRYSAEAVVKALEEAGFCDIKVEVKDFVGSVEPRKFFPRLIGIIPARAEGHRREAIDVATNLANETSELQIRRNSTRITARMPEANTGSTPEGARGPEETRSGSPNRSSDPQTSSIDSKPSLDAAPASGRSSAKNEFDELILPPVDQDLSRTNEENENKNNLRRSAERSPENVVALKSQAVSLGQEYRKNSIEIRDLQRRLEPKAFLARVLDVKTQMRLRQLKAEQRKIVEQVSEIPRDILLQHQDSLTDPRAEQADRLARDRVSPNHGTDASMDRNIAAAENQNLFADDEILEVHVSARDRELLAGIPTELINGSVANNQHAFAAVDGVLYAVENGVHVLQQEGPENCSGATSTMLAMDAVARHGLAELRPGYAYLMRGSLGSSEEIANHLEREFEGSGVDVKMHKLGRGTPHQSVEEAVREIGRLVEQNGPVEMGIGGELGSHSIIIDAVDLNHPEGARVTLRDPWHGWQISVGVESLYRRMRSVIEWRIVQCYRDDSAQEGQKNARADLDSKEGLRRSHESEEKSTKDQVYENGINAALQFYGAATGTDFTYYQLQIGENTTGSPMNVLTRRVVVDSLGQGSEAPTLYLNPRSIEQRGGVEHYQNWILLHELAHEIGESAGVAEAEEALFADQRISELSSKLFAEDPLRVRSHLNEVCTDGIGFQLGRDYGLSAHPEAQYGERLQRMSQAFLAARAGERQEIAYSELSMQICSLARQLSVCEALVAARQSLGEAVPELKLEAQTLRNELSELDQNILNESELEEFVGIMSRFFETGSRLDTAGTTKAAKEQQGEDLSSRKPYIRPEWLAAPEFLELKRSELMPELEGSIEARRMAGLVWLRDTVAEELETNGPHAAIRHFYERINRVPDGPLRIPRNIEQRLREERESENHQFFAPAKEPEVFDPRSAADAQLLAQALKEHLNVLIQIEERLPLCLDKADLLTGRRDATAEERHELAKKQELAESLKEEFKLRLDSSGRWQQSEENCLDIAQEIMRRAGYKLPDYRQIPSDAPITIDSLRNDWGTKVRFGRGPELPSISTDAFLVIRECDPNFTAALGLPGVDGDCHPTVEVAGVDYNLGADESSGFFVEFKIPLVKVEDPPETAEFFHRPPKKEDTDPGRDNVRRTHESELDAASDNGKTPPSTENLGLDTIDSSAIANELGTQVTDSLAVLSSALDSHSAEIKVTSEMESVLQGIERIEYELGLLVKQDPKLLENDPAFIKRLRERSIEVAGLLTTAHEFMERPPEEHTLNSAFLALAIKSETELLLTGLKQCESDFEQLKELRKLEKLIEGIEELEGVRLNKNKKTKKDSQVKKESRAERLKVGKKSFNDPESLPETCDVAARVMSENRRGLGTVHPTDAGLWLDQETYVDMKDFVLSALESEERSGSENESIITREQLYYPIEPEQIDPMSFDVDYSAEQENSPESDRELKLDFSLEREQFEGAEDGWVPLPLGASLMPTAYECLSQAGFDTVDVDFRLTPWGVVEIKLNGSIDEIFDGESNVYLILNCENMNREHPHYKKFYNLLRKYQPETDLEYSGKYEDIVNTALAESTIGMSDYSVAKKVKESLERLDLVYGMAPGLQRLVAASGPFASSFLMGSGISACGNSSRRDALLLQAAGLNTAVVGGLVAYNFVGGGSGIATPGHAQVMIYTEKGPLVYEATSTANSSLTIDRERLEEIVDEYEAKLSSSGMGHEEAFRLGEELRERIVIEADETQTNEYNRVPQLGDSFGKGSKATLEERVQDAEAELKQYARRLIESDRPIDNVLDFVLVLTQGEESELASALDNDFVKTLNLSRIREIQHPTRSPEEEVHAVFMGRNPGGPEATLDGFAVFAELLTRIANNPIERQERRMRAALLLNSLKSMAVVNQESFPYMPLDFQAVFEGRSKEEILKDGLTDPVRFFHNSPDYTNTSQLLFNLELLTPMQQAICLPMIEGAVSISKEQNSEAAALLRTRGLDAIYNTFALLNTEGDIYDVRADITRAIEAAPNDWLNETEETYGVFNACRQLLSNYDREVVEAHRLGKESFLLWSPERRCFVPTVAMKNILENILEDNSYPLSLDDDMPDYVRLGLGEKFVLKKIEEEIACEGGDLNPPTSEYPASFFNYILEINGLSISESIALKAIQSGVIDPQATNFEDLGWDIENELDAAKKLIESLDDFSARTICGSNGELHTTNTALFVLHLLNQDLNPYAESFHQADRVFADELSSMFPSLQSGAIPEAMKAWAEFDRATYDEFCRTVSDKLKTEDWADKVLRKITASHKDASLASRVFHVHNGGSAVLPASLAASADKYAMDLSLPAKLDQIVSSKHSQLREWMGEVFSRDTREFSAEVAEDLEQRLEKVPGQVNQLLRIIENPSRLAAASQGNSNSPTWVGLEDGKQLGFSGDYTGLSVLQPGMAVNPRDLRWDKLDEKGNPHVIQRSKSTLPIDRNIKTKIHVDLEALAAQGKLSPRGIPMGIEQLLFKIASISNRGDQNYSIGFYYRGREILGGMQSIKADPQSLKEMLSDVLEAYNIADTTLEAEKHFDLSRPIVKPWRYTGLSPASRDAQKVIVITDESCERESIADLSRIPTLQSIWMNEREIRLGKSNQGGGADSRIRRSHESGEGQGAREIDARVEERQRKAVHRERVLRLLAESDEAIAPVLALGENMHNRRDRMPYVQRFSYAIPSEGAVNTIIRHAPNSIVEIGAGKGLWSHLLSEQGKAEYGEDYDVAAFDISPPGDESYHPVSKGEETLAAEYSDRALLLVWPPNDDPMAYEALKAYAEAGGDTLVFVGLPYSATGDGNFHQELENNWDCVAEEDTPNFALREDKVYIYKRKSASESHVIQASPDRQVSVDQGLSPDEVSKRIAEIDQVLSASRFGREAQALVEYQSVKDRHKQASPVLRWTFNSRLAALSRELDDAQQRVQVGKYSTEEGLIESSRDGALAAEKCQLLRGEIRRVESELQAEEAANGLSSKYRKMINDRGALNEKLKETQVILRLVNDWQDYFERTLSERESADTRNYRRSHDSDLVHESNVNSGQLNSAEDFRTHVPPEVLTGEMNAQARQTTIASLQSVEDSISEIRLKIVDTLPAETADVLLRKYQEIIAQAERVQYSILEFNRPDASETEIEQIASLLLSRANRLVERMLEDPRLRSGSSESLAENVSRMQGLKSEILLFGATFRGLGKVPLSDIQNTTIACRSGMRLTVRERAKMEENYRENCVNNKYPSDLTEMLIEGFRESLKNRSARFYSVEHHGEMVCFLRIVPQERGCAHFGAFNSRPEASGFSIGASFLEQVVELEGRHTTLKAETVKATGIHDWYERDFDFEVVDEILNYEDTGVDVFLLERRPPKPVDAVPVSAYEYAPERVDLAEGESELSLVELMDRYGVSRATAWRAKKRGYFYPDYHTRREEALEPQGSSDILGAPFMLSSEELSLPVQSLMRRYSLSFLEARAAQAQGYVNNTAEAQEAFLAVCREEERTRRAETDPRYTSIESRDYRYYVTPEDRIASLVELQTKYNISRKTAERIRKRGYFSPNRRAEEGPTDAADNRYARQRIELSERESQLPFAVKMLVFDLPKATASRVADRRFFYRNFHGREEQRLETVGRDETTRGRKLTRQEQQLPISALSRHFGVGYNRARKIKETGYVNVTKEEKLKLYQKEEAERAANLQMGVAPTSPEYRHYFTPVERIEPRSAIAVRYNLTTDQARRAQERGYYWPNKAPRPKNAVHNNQRREAGESE